MRSDPEIRSILSGSGGSEHVALQDIVKLPWFRRPRLGRIVGGGQKSEYTAIIPIFNQEGIIARFLEHHLGNSSLEHDIVAIFDRCTDDSRLEFWNAIDNQKSGKLRNVVEIITDIPFFETACDNVGFAVADTRFVIELQPDLILDTAGYDERLLRALADDNVFCASGRCGHALADVYGGRTFIEKVRYSVSSRRTRVGLFGEKIESEGASVCDVGDVAFLCETVNRGPLAFRRHDLERLNYFDAENFFLGNDDHDLNLRAWISRGQLPAYVPMKVSSRLQEGSTRKKRDPINAEIFSKLSQRQDNSTLKRFAKFYQPYCKPKAFFMQKNA